MSKPKTTKPLNLKDFGAKNTLELLRRRSYWREVGEVMLMSAFVPDNFRSLTAMEEPPKRWDRRQKPPKLTLGEILKRMPPEHREKLMNMPAGWLIGLLVPDRDDGVRYFNDPNDIAYMPKVRWYRIPGSDEALEFAMAVEPPALPEQDAKKASPRKPPKAKRKATKKTAKKTAKKTTSKKKTAKKTSKKKAPKKKANTGPRVAKTQTKKKSGDRRARRSTEDLDAALRDIDRLHSDPGLTKADVRKELNVSGGVINKVLQRAMMTGDLVVHGEGRKATYRWIGGAANTPPEVDTRQTQLPGTDTAQ